MSITSKEAADIARRYGLGLSDAAGLLSIADNAVEAEEIAAKFAEDHDPEVAEREFSRRLFADHTRATGDLFSYADAYADSWLDQATT